MAEVENSISKVAKTSCDDESDIRKDLLCYLQKELRSFIAKNSHLTLNSLSKKVSVSEPSLRRLYKGQIKTLPTMTTILSLLSFINGTDDIKKLLQSLPVEMGKFLESKINYVREIDQLSYSEDLSLRLKDPLDYLIFKLSSHEAGLKEEQLTELFGFLGLERVKQLEKDGLVKWDENRWRSLKGNFSLSHELFVDHFKSVASFIKPHKHSSAPNSLSPIFSNFSVSLNKQAYSKLLNVQRQANKKIIEIMTSESSKGEIPTFFLNAIDTLDTKSADEFLD